MTQPTASPTPSRIAPLLAELATLTIDGHPMSPAKKVIRGDAPLGTLIEPLQRLWLMREDRRIIADAIVTEQIGYIEAHEAGHRETERPPGLCENFMAQMRDSEEKLKEPYQAFSDLNALFVFLVSKEFDVPEDKQIIGIREGFVVVCRRNDLCDDLDDPKQRLNEVVRGAAVRQLERVIGSLFGGEGSSDGEDDSGLFGALFRTDRRRPTPEPAPSASTPPAEPATTADH